MKARMSGLFLGAFAAFAAVGFVWHQNTQKFDFTDPKGVSGLSFSADSMLEPIVGQTNAISGEVSFDRIHPEKSTGKIVVQTKSIQCASAPLTQSMQGDWCLNGTKFPTIEFVVKKVSDVQTPANGPITGKITGDFTFHGVTKEVVADASVTYLPEMIQKRGGMPGKTGDLLVLRAKFSFNRLDFNVAKELSTDTIGNQIDVKISCVGVSPK